MPKSSRQFLITALFANDRISGLTKTCSGKSFADLLFLTVKELWKRYYFFKTLSQSDMEIQSLENVIVEHDRKVI